MRAFVITGPSRAEILAVPEPLPSPGVVVVDVERVGVCGTDIELFKGTMPYLHDGNAHYPLRPGHEWVGRVSHVASDADEAWLGVRVTGDTMLGCGVCHRCRNGRHHVCAHRQEIGVRGGWPGALAEKLPVPTGALHRIPEDMSAANGAAVEPAGCSWRGVDAARVRAGQQIAIWGPGTLGLLALQIALDRGANVDMVGLDPRSLDLAVHLGARAGLTPGEVDGRSWDAVIETTGSPSVPAHALEHVDDGGRLALLGIATDPSPADLRDAVLRDITICGLLSPSAGLDPAIKLMQARRLDIKPLLGPVAPLDEAVDVLHRLAAARGGRPKLQIDPRI